MNFLADLVFIDEKNTIDLVNSTNGASFCINSQKTIKCKNMISFDFLTKF